LVELLSSICADLPVDTVCSPIHFVNEDEKAIALPKQQQKKRPAKLDFMSCYRCEVAIFVAVWF
jgi:hypothetical protein